MLNNVRRDRRGLLLMLTALALLVALRGTSQAQPTELLQNPSFDTWYGIGGSNTVPMGWTLTTNISVGSARQMWVFNEFPGFDSSWHISTTRAVFTMYGAQFVAGVRSGTRLRFSAYGNLFTCDRDDSCIADGRRTSQPESGARVRIGVDPRGGNDPAASSVVWSPYISPFDRFEQMTLDFQSQNDSGVTVYLNATQSVAMLLNNVYWDNTSLQVIGPAAPAASPTPRVVPWVTPQGMQPDGSIVHVVGEGDTLASIAVAYDVTIAHIRELNGMPPEEFLLRIGQRLLIRGPTPLNVTYIIITNTPTLDPLGPTATLTLPPTTRTATPSPRPGGRGPMPTPGVTIITLVPPTRTPGVGMPAAPPDDPAMARLQAPEAQRAPVETAKGGGRRLLRRDARPAAWAAGPRHAASLRTQVEAMGTVCVLAFEDANTNRFRDEGERLLAGLSFTLQHTERLNRTETSLPDRSVCFEALAPGVYSLRVQPPMGHGLTTPAEMRVVVSEGANLVVQAGAAPGYEQTPALDARQLQATASAPRAEAPAWLRSAIDNSGLVVMAAAGLTLIGGLTLARLVRHQ